MTHDVSSTIVIKYQHLVKYIYLNLSLTKATSNMIMKKKDG